MNHGKQARRADDRRPGMVRRFQPAAKQESAEQAFFRDWDKHDDGNQQQRKQVRAVRRLIDVGLEPINNIPASEPADRVANGDQYGERSNADYNFAASGELVSEVLHSLPLVSGGRKQQSHLYRRRNEYEQDDRAAVLADALELPEIEAVP